MSASDTHNRMAADMIRQIGALPRAEQLVLIESLTLGVLLLHKVNHRTAGEVLDALTMAVLERLQP